MDFSDSSPMLKRPQQKLYAGLLAAVIIYDYIVSPLPILAKEEPKAKPAEQQLVTSFSAAVATAATTPELVPEISQKISKEAVSAPARSIKVVQDHGYHVLTAYTSEVAQTDSSPCITANGFNVCRHGQEDTIAANFLKFGTKVRIPELFGDRIFVVRDRMNRRHAERVDVWMKQKPDALKFGVRKARIEIVEEVEN